MSKTEDGVLAAGEIELRNQCGSLCLAAVESVATRWRIRRALSLGIRAIKGFTASLIEDCYHRDGLSPCIFVKMVARPFW